MASQRILVLLFSVLLLWAAPSFASATSCVECNASKHEPIGTAENLLFVAAVNETKQSKFERIICRKVKNHAKFEGIKKVSKKLGQNVTEFFLTGECRNEFLDERETLRYIPPIHTILYDILDRYGVAQNFFKYFDDLVRNNQALAPEMARILNRKDRFNRTALDYLEVLYHGRYRLDKSARLFLGYIRGDMCKRGGKHSLPDPNCKAVPLYQY